MTFNSSTGQIALFTMWIKLHCMMLLLFLWTPAKAEFSDQQHLRHFFNARLLEPGEFHLSLLGASSYGLAPSLEIGTQLLGYLYSEPIYNLAIKHRMFHTEKFQTSFNANFGILPFSGNTGSDWLYISMHGIVTTVNLNSENFLNFGLWDLYLYQEPDVNHNEARIHIIAPMVGYDWYLTKSLAISGIFVQPVYGYSQSSADTGDAIGEIDFLRSDPSSARIFFLTAIYSLKRFNTEAGILCLGNACIPYLNLFWRFHGK